MPIAKVPRQTPNVGALWAILWRATILLGCAVAVVVFAFRAEWWKCGAAFLIYLSIAFTISRFSPARHDPPQEEFGGGVLL